MAKLELASANLAGREKMRYSESISRRAVMANREQRSNREKKKPKSDKKAAPIPAAKTPAYVEPQLIRKPHKGKDWV
ncbi:MAG TPA: hypothetical protein VGJ08_02600 [Rhizomicrobium sp.]|jgi:hypothetical protein